MKWIINRIVRERVTVEKMIRIYCRKNHNTKNQLCSDCNSILDYAMKRLEKCPLIQNKPTCLNCPIHCYKTAKREHIRKIMRFSGPKMLYHHPILAFFHILDNKVFKKKNFK